MAQFFRLQDLTSQSAAIRQPVEEAVEVGAFNTLVVQVRIPALAGTSGTLKLITAATLEETAFITPPHWPASVDIDLALGPNQIVVLPDPMRYLRWEITALVSGTPVEFLIDVVGRD